MLQVKVIQATIFKQRPVQSSDLPESMKVAVSVGDLIDLSSYSFERGHLRLVLTQAWHGSQVWYGFAEHIQVIKDGKVAFPESTPESIELTVPYLSQTDNEINPSGSCNVTSTAMVLRFLGVSRNRQYRQYEQFEDELYAYCDDHGLDRHNPNDLVTLIQAYGAVDNFRCDATIPLVKGWLTQQRSPVIVHGYFTSFGHVVVLTGFDQDGFWVNDPYGQWHDWGYDKNAPGETKGKGVHYAYDVIQQTCLPDGACWVHFVHNAAQ